ncbi:tRNA lysidine(34) synthetase TilS [Hyphococcus formosus]|uniref:tRNA lysidine(34) synthetase TilS n=1 Tax=Hyphococcus formosus TaxID=3143534 RepID=UPI00398A9242
MTANKPISQSAFDERAKALDLPKKFAIAVSGGRDSIALARLAAGYAKATGAEVLALTVDHGLRPEAAKEAAKVSQWCAAMGLSHRLLRWAGEKPQTGIQAAARSARYRLLIEAAQSDGCEAILTAHSLDDQAETVFMRLGRGAGPRGLSAMKEETWVAAGAGEPIRLLRPLLGFRRLDITRFLDEAGQDYVDDPSNDDPTYERVRARAVIGALEEQNLLTAAALAKTAEEMGRAHRRHCAQEEAAFEAQDGKFYRWGGVSLNPDPKTDLDVMTGLLRRLIYSVGGAVHYPNQDQARSAYSQVTATGTATLGGALLKMRKDMLWIIREPAAITGRADITPLGRVPLDQPILWDNRFIITSQAGFSGEIGPLTENDIAQLAAGSGFFEGPKEALATLPGIYADGILIGAPALLFNQTEAAVLRSLTPERYVSEIVRFS